jgi:hypothetical protein
VLGAQIPKDQIEAAYGAIYILYSSDYRERKITAPTEKVNK